jgi:hypothetical protein
MRLRSKRRAGTGTGNEGGGAGGPPRSGGDTGGGGRSVGAARRRTSHGTGRSAAVAQTRRSKRLIAHTRRMRTGWPRTKCVRTCSLGVKRGQVRF